MFTFGKMLNFYYIMYIGQINKVRYQKVLDSLRDNYIIKGILALCAWFWTTFSTIFETNAELIVLLFFAILVDWITGNIKAKRNNYRCDLCDEEILYTNKNKIHSLGWRQTVVKTLEYAAFLLVLSGISNVFGGYEGNGWVVEFFKLVHNIDVFGYFYVIFTELKSISENVSGKENTISKLFDYVKNKLFDEKDIDL